MIIEATREDYVSLVLGRAPRTFQLTGTPIAPVEVIKMLGDVAERVRSTFSPTSWLIVEGNELVGLCSVTRPVEKGVIDIGYGVAPSRQNRGIAGRAIRDIVAWSRATERVDANCRDQRHQPAFSTGPDAQRLIEVGDRLDDEDGPLICWRCSSS